MKQSTAVPLALKPHEDKVDRSMWMPTYSVGMWSRGMKFRHLDHLITGLGTSALSSRGRCYSHLGASWSRCHAPVGLMLLCRTLLCVIGCWQHPLTLPNGCFLYSNMDYSFIVSIHIPEKNGQFENKGQTSSMAHGCTWTQRWTVACLHGLSKHTPSKSFLCCYRWKEHNSGDVCFSL